MKVNFGVLLAEEALQKHEKGSVEAGEMMHLTEKEAMA